MAAAEREVGTHIGAGSHVDRAGGAAGRVRADRGAARVALWGAADLHAGPHATAAKPILTVTRPDDRSER
jgi:hypothetical protein